MTVWLPRNTVVVIVRSIGDSPRCGFQAPGPAGSLRLEGQAGSTRHRSGGGRAPLERLAQQRLDAAVVATQTSRSMLRSAPRLTWARASAAPLMPPAEVPVGRRPLRCTQPGRATGHMDRGRRHARGLGQPVQLVDGAAHPTARLTPPLRTTPNRISSSREPIPLVAPSSPFTTEITPDRRVVAVRGSGLALSRVWDKKSFRTSLFARTRWTTLCGCGEGLNSRCGRVTDPLELQLGPPGSAGGRRLRRCPPGRWLSGGVGSG